jgi:hypothetical protein
MAQGKERVTAQGKHESGVQVFGTNPVDPDEGRIFVMTKMGWYERMEVQSGAAAFTHVAGSESELREILSREHRSADLVPLTGEYRKMVMSEFIEQAPSYKDSPEYSPEDPFERDSQEYHQHE